MDAKRTRRRRLPAAVAFVLAACLLAAVLTAVLAPGNKSITDPADAARPPHMDLQGTEPQPDLALVAGRGSHSGGADAALLRRAFRLAGTALALSAGSASLLAVLERGHPEKLPQGAAPAFPWEQLGLVAEIRAGPGGAAML